MVFSALMVKAINVMVPRLHVFLLWEFVYNSLSIFIPLQITEKHKSAISISQIALYYEQLMDITFDEEDLHFVSKLIVR